MDALSIPIFPALQHHFFDEFCTSIVSEGGPDARIHGGFAFATVGGVQNLLSNVGGLDEWRSTDKHFVIGIYHAITEPYALELLRSQPNSVVRIYIPGNRLDRSATDSPPLFHPKVLAIASRTSGAISFLQSGSANLTSSAISKPPRNIEFCLSVQKSEGSDELKGLEAFGPWWDMVWQSSRVVDRRVVRKYAELRARILSENPILKSIAETPSSIGEAEHFFCEVGAGSGPQGQRHQIEFPQSLVEFFGPVRRRRRDLILASGGKTWRGRPLSFKTTTYNVEIWRLGMPTQNSGGVPIANRVIKFRRMQHRTRSKFEFEVVDVVNEAFRGWVHRANLDGHLGSTRGTRPRQYGFY